MRIENQCLDVEDQCTISALPGHRLPSRRVPGKLAGQFLAYRWAKSSITPLTLQQLSIINAEGKELVTGGRCQVAGSASPSESAYPTMLLKKAALTAKQRRKIMKIGRARQRSYTENTALSHYSQGSVKGRALEVVPPGNEGLSDDLAENKGKLFSPAGISNDVVENMQLILIIQRSH
jgi:hypothetical protein